MLRRNIAIGAVVILMISMIHFLPEEESKMSNEDSGGYKYVDGLEPEPILDPDYQSINSHPDAVGLDTSDWQSVKKVSIGFNFEFYGNTYSEIYISTYGVMSFTSYPGNLYYNYNSHDIPDTSTPNGVIAPYWSYYNAYSNSKDGIIVLNTEIEGEKVFIVEWNMNSNSGQFQVLLFEGGMIRFEYKSTPSWNYNGDRATIGIESPDGRTGTSYINWQSLSQDLFPTPFAIAFVKDEVTVRKLELMNGDGTWGDIVYAGSKPYRFQTELVHSDGAGKMMNVILTLGSRWTQENIRLQYSNRNKTFNQLTGFGHATLLSDESVYDINGNYLTLDFLVDFKMEYPSEEYRNVSVRASGRSAIPAKLDKGETYWVETNVEWTLDDLRVFRDSDRRTLTDRDYIAGNELIRFSGLRVLYENSDVQPPHTLYELEIVDNFGTRKTAFIQQGNYLDVTWRTVDQTVVMSWDIIASGFPERSMLSSDLNFNLSVDIEPPDEISTLTIHPDSREDAPSEYDNDGQVWVKWEQTIDGGSGVGRYIVRAKNDGGFLTEKEVQGHLDQTVIGGPTSNALPEGEVNISINPVDDVGNIGDPTWFIFKIDLTGPRYSLVDPEPEDWLRSTRPDVKILLEDDLTGVNGSSMEYRVSKDGGVTFEEWTSLYYFGSEKSVIRTIEPELAEGKDNIIEIKGKDVAGSEETRSEQIPLWVDARDPAIEVSEPEVDINGTTTKWLTDIGSVVRVKIHDFRGAGVDPDRMSYRISTDNGETYTADVPLQGEGYVNTNGFFEYIFSIQGNWVEGDSNILVVDAYDLIGRNITETYRIRFDVTPEIQVISPLPSEELLDNQTIRFTLEIVDADGTTDHDVRWLSNIEGPLGFGPNIEVRLTSGEHIIQVQVEDGVHTVTNIFTVSVRDHLLDDPRYRDTDNDGMNDSYEVKYGLNPNADDSMEDADGDGYTNIEEYFAGTSPVLKKENPGNTIYVEEFPILPIVLLGLSILVLLGASLFMVRQINKGKTTAPPPSMMAPPSQNLLPPASQRQQFQQQQGQQLSPPAGPPTG